MYVVVNMDLFNKCVNRSLLGVCSCIFALITTKVEISMLVLTGLTLLALTQSFECKDHATGKMTECRLCGDVNPLTGDTFECKAAKESFKHSLEGFSSSVVWLIFAAFHLGKAVEVTQLGRRLSLLMIKIFGKRIMGLAYAIVLSGMYSTQINVMMMIVPSGGKDDDKERKTKKTSRVENDV